MANGQEARRSESFTTATCSRAMMRKESLKHCICWGSLVVTVQEGRTSWRALLNSDIVDVTRVVGEMGNSGSLVR